LQVLPAVKTARDRLAADPDWTHEYLPIDGYAPFLRQSEALLYGGNADDDFFVASAQALSGTGAVRLALEFLRRHHDVTDVVYVPKTTWSNHRSIATDAGYAVREYRYLLAAESALDGAGLLEDLHNAKEGAIVLLHLCAHNPSGVDPSPATWAKIAEIVAERRLFPVFDSAYLGFATGDPDVDAAPFRSFVAKGLYPWACLSYSKNFGLYSERVGAVHATVPTAHAREAVVGHLKKVARAMYSNPPAFGARLVATVLSDAALRDSWRGSLREMAGRIQTLRHELRTRLEDAASPKRKRDWSHVTSQIGMFSFTGLSVEAVHRLRAEHHVYMLDNGRISMAGLNSGNLARFADAVLQVLDDIEKEHTTTHEEL